VLAVASWFGNAAAPLWGTTGGGIALCARVYLCDCTCVPLLQELPLLPPTVTSLLGDTTTCAGYSGAAAAKFASTFALTHDFY
jgi:hypothetical protein